MNEVVLGTETLVDGNKEVVWGRKTVRGDFVVRDGGSGFEPEGAR